MVKSPCTRNCELDDDLKYCLGCGRTLQELQTWRWMTEEEKKAVIQRIKEMRELK